MCPDGRRSLDESVRDGDLRETATIFEHVAHEGRHPDALEATQAVDSVDLVETDLARVEHGEVYAVDVPKDVNGTWRRKE